MDRWKKSAIDAFIHAAVWLLTYHIMVALAADSPSKAVYGILSGWWCTLYVGYVLKIDIRAFLILLLSVLLSELAAFYSGWNFYHDPPSEMSCDFALTMFAIGVGFASPILVNGVVTRILSWFSGRTAVETRGPGLSP